MRLCSNCNHNNIEGILFCEECGHPLHEEASLATSTSTKKLQSVPDEMGMKATWGTARFKQEASIIIHIRDAPEPIVVQLRSRETLLGRHDPNTTQDVNLDLTPYGALERGVSRKHAALHHEGDTLTLVDLDSVNGTYLNGQRLLPNQPRVVRDGDEIRFGKLILHIYFK